MVLFFLYYNFNRCRYILDKYSLFFFFFFFLNTYLLKQCLPCIPGSYNELTGQTVCKSCEAGTHADQAQQKICQNCLVGTFSQAGSATCTKCGKGQFQDEVKKALCKDCLVNTFTDKTGLALCQDCSVGEKSEAGSASCVRCGAGEAGTPCTKCASGKFRAGSDTDAKTCDACPKGFYQSDAGQGNCLPCVPGEYQDVLASVDCKICKAGQYSKSVSTINGCTSCPTGYYTKSKGMSSCSACGAGRFGSTENPGMCDTCPVGWKRGDEDLDLTRCIICRRGKNTILIASTSCQGCKAGEYGERDGLCSSCKQGYYQDGEGSLMCKACPIDTYLSEIGKTSKAECVFCAKERTTGNKVGEISQHSCICKAADNETCLDHTVSNDPNCGYFKNETGGCIACPAGAQCDTHGMPLSNITATSGFWRPDPSSFDPTWGDKSKESTIFVDCAADIYPGTGGPALGQARCCPNGVCDQPWNIHPDQQCKKGFAGPVCASCAEEHAMVGESCNYCKGGPDIGAAFGALLTVGAVWTLVVTCLFCRATKKAIKASKDVLKGFTGPVVGRKNILTTRNKNKFYNKLNKLKNMNKPPPAPPAGPIPILSVSEKTDTTEKTDKTDKTDKKLNVGAVKQHTEQEEVEKVRKKLKEEEEHHHHHKHHRKVKSGKAAGRQMREQMFNARMSDASDADGQTKMEWDLVGHQFKIMLTSLQITSAICITFDDVPWPRLFKDFTINLSFINLDLSPLFGLTNCRLSLPFLDKMVLHMCLPLVLLGAVFVIYYIFSCCHKKKANIVSTAHHSLTSKIAISVILLLYPGVCVRVFQGK